MRYAKGHKETTRQHIIDAASKRFREDGVAAAGLATVMAEAGLTNGAFYAHFESKEELVRAALLNVLEKRSESLRAAAEEGGIAAVLRNYLSARHRDAPGKGCPTAALAAEIARHPKATREAFTRKTGETIDFLAGLLPAGSLAARRRAAVALYGLMIGTLQLARAVSDKGLSDEILESGIRAAIALAGGVDKAE